MAKFLYSIPNALTFLRLILIPIFVYLLIDPSRTMVHIALCIFILAAITDYIDGFIARRWGAVSDFGKLLDPLADKILVMSALVMLASLRSDLDGHPWVPGWMVVMVIAREIWVTGLRAVAASQGNIVAAGGAGKWKSFLQMIAIILLLVHDTPVELWGVQIPCELVGRNLLAFSLVFSYVSAVQYSGLVLFGTSLSLEIRKDPERRIIPPSAVQGVELPPSEEQIN